MLDINIEFVRGLLIVGLEGNLNNNSVFSLRNNLLTIIRNGGIKYLMFNLNNCVLEEDIDIFDECNKLIKKNDGRTYISGLDKNLLKGEYYYVDSISNKLSILREISEC